MNQRLISTEKLRKAIAIAEQIEKLEAQLKRILTDAIAPRRAAASDAEETLGPEDRLRIDDYLKSRGKPKQTPSHMQVGGLSSGKMGADMVRG